MIPEKDRMNFINQVNIEKFKTRDTFVSDFLDITLSLPKGERVSFIQKINHKELTDEYILTVSQSSSTQYLGQFSIMNKDDVKVDENSPQPSK
jgi:hypothetical protein